MNYLFIDTSFNKEIRVAVLKSNELNFIIEKVEHEYSEKLITVIDRVLQENNISINQINKVFVVEGPGRFSALRTGVSTANTLAWQLNVSIIPFPAIDSTKDYWDQVINLIKLIKRDEQGFNKSLIPKYGKEPNITIKKGE